MPSERCPRRRFDEFSQCETADVDGAPPRETGWAEPRYFVRPDLHCLPVVYFAVKLRMLRTACQGKREHEQTLVSAALFFQCEPDFQCYLIVADGSVFNVTSRLKNFEPFHFTQSLGYAGYGILNGIFYAFSDDPTSSRTL